MLSRSVRRSLPRSSAGALRHHDPCAALKRSGSDIRWSRLSAEEGRRKVFRELSGGNMNFEEFDRLLSEQQAHAAAVGDKPTPVLPLSIVDKDAVKNALPYLGYAAYSTLALGFICTDILKLRGFLFVGYSALTTYHSLQLRPLRIPLFGSLGFAIVNLYYGIKIFRDRFVTLTSEEQHIYNTAFKEHMTEREFKKLIEVAEIKTCDEFEEMMTMGMPNSNLYVLVDGVAEVSFHKDIPADAGGKVGDRELVVIEATEGLIGELTFLEETTTATASVVARPGCKYVCWNKHVLQSESLEKDPSVRRALEVMIGKALARKLHRTSHLLANDSTDHKMTEQVLMQRRKSFDHDRKETLINEVGSVTFEPANSVGNPAFQQASQQIQ